MKRLMIVFGMLIGFNVVFAQPASQHDLNFNKLANRWDEAIPLGNALIGALVW